ncbi:MAG: hypothetical protein R3260_03480 [Pseudomonas sp.]|nr:hypothetical protein [Pseudomonas sp.]
MNVTDFLDDCMPRLSGAEEALTTQEIFAAIRQFCEEGLAWVYDFGPVTITALDTHVTINVSSGLPTDTKAGYVLKTEFRSSNTDNFKDFLPTLSLPSNPDDTATDPTSYYAESPSSLLLIPQPTETHTNGFRAKVSVIPTATTVTLPDEFETHWRDAVIDGVMARMFNMPNKPWSNAQLALLHGRRFRNHIKRTRDIVKRRYGTDSSGWTFPNFACQ